MSWQPRHKHRACPCGCGDMADECMQPISARNVLGAFQVESESPRERLARVEALHQTDGRSLYCPTCRTPWPCATIDAIEGKR